MRVLVWTLVAASAVAAAPQTGVAQDRDRAERIREVRRQQEARQRDAWQRARQEAYDRDRRRDGDRSIADILLDRRDRRERDRDRRDRDVWRRSDDWRFEGRRDNGPPFCRSGQGHPVHGRQWCRDKGWALGDDRYDRYDRRDDVLRRAPYPGRERDRRGEVVGRGRGAVR